MSLSWFELPLETVTINELANDCISIHTWVCVLISFSFVYVCLRVCTRMCACMCGRPGVDAGCLLQIPLPSPNKDNLFLL